MGRQHGVLHLQSLPSDHPDETWQGAEVVGVSDKWQLSYSKTIHRDEGSELYKDKYSHICISRCFMLDTLFNLDAPLRELCCSLSGSLSCKLNTIHYNQ